MCYPGDELVLCTDAVAEWAARGYEQNDPPVWSDFWHMSDDDWQSGVAWLRQQRQMRTDDATMLMLRVVDDRVETQAGDEKPGEAASGQEAGDSAALGWLKAASKDLKTVSEQVAEQVAEQVDQASARVKKGLRGLKDRAWKKYRDTFGKKHDPPQ